MATCRWLIATGLLLLALSLLVTIGHRPSALGGDEVAQAAEVDTESGQPCPVSPSCSPVVAALQTDALGVDWPSSPAHFQRISELSYRSPHLTKDPPPPRRDA